MPGRIGLFKRSFDVEPKVEPVQQHEGSKLLAELRDAVARIEAGFGSPSRPRRSDPRPQSAVDPERFRLGDGSLPFDVMLGGGLRRGTLHEIVAAQWQDDGAAAGFAAALACRGTGTGPLVWIVEDCAAHETGSPYRPGIAAHGLDPDHLLLVRTKEARATLWAAEEALRAKSSLVLAELWNAKHYNLAASRRLLLAAQAGRGTLLLLHAGLSGKAAALSSAAETRFAVAAYPSAHLPSAGSRLPIPGAAVFAVRLLKLRLGAQPGFDAARVHRLVWTPAKRCFDDHPVPFGVSTSVADRPDTPQDSLVRFRRARA